MRSTPLILFCLLSLLLVALLLNKQVPLGAGSASDKAFPTISLRTLDEKTVWNQNALMGKVTVLNVFASWCAPCATEMPELAALKKQFPTIQLEGIAWNDSPKTLTGWLKTHGNPFGHVWLDKTGDATIALGIRGIPETFVIDATGTVRYRLSGPLTEALRNGEFGAMIKTLLAEQADAQ